MIPARVVRLSPSSTAPTTDKPIACLSQVRAYQSACNSLTDNGVPEFIIYLCDDIDIALAVYTYDGKGCATCIGQSGDGKVMCLFCDRSYASYTIDSNGDTIDTEVYQFNKSGTQSTYIDKDDSQYWYIAANVDMTIVTRFDENVY